MTRWAVVLAGGVGSRFWPLSTQERPKQLLPLVASEPMLLEQLRRIRPLAEAQRTLVLTNASLVEPIARLAPDLVRDNIIAEPRPAGTAAALAWAAHVIQQRGGKDATMLSVHADWAIADPNGFRDTLSLAASAAEAHHALVTVGIVPTRPDPGLGYIEPGDSVSQGVRRVSRFVEKPTRERAQVMVDSGYLWNSGIFAWRVGDFLGEVHDHAPAIAEALDRNPKSLEKFFAAIPKPVAVDTAVLEHSERVLVVPGDFGWDDVGTWGSLQRVRARDAQGNAVSGSVHALDASNNVVHAEGQDVVLYGVNDLVVVARDGLVVVTTVDRSADLKRLVESLPPGLKGPS
ncbi:MAG: mannose-1-phosphate guanylyltransferase [Gemmatimonadaceae bacterium]